MSPRPWIAVAAVVLLAAGAAGCGKKRLARNNMPLKDWIVGNWVRTDDYTVWQWKADGEMITTGQLPVAGSYGVQEPNTVTFLCSGGNAVTTSSMLDVKMDTASQSLTIVFEVKEDEMRVVGMKSDVVWRKSAK